MSWNPFTWIPDIFQAVSAPITEYVKGKAQRKLTEIESNAKVAEIKANALLEAAKTGNTIALQEAKGSLDWDQEALRQSQFSWKDEYLLILFTLPVICAFIPGLSVYIDEGFTVVGRMPDWYKMILLGMVAASFGLRWIVAPLINKWGNK